MCRVCKEREQLCVYMVEREAHAVQYLPQAQKRCAESAKLSKAWPVASTVKHGVTREKGGEKECDEIWFLGFEIFDGMVAFNGKGRAIPKPRTGASVSGVDRGGGARGGGAVWGRRHRGGSSAGGRG